MKPRTPVYVVCSPRQGVGKTLIARLLTEFFIADRRPVEGFDIDPGGPSFADHLPGCTTTAAIADTRGQMTLFDRLVRADQVPKVVDVGSTAFERFFGVLDEIGYLVEARRQNVQTIVLFVANPDPASVKAYGAIERMLTGLTLVPVHNEGIARASQTRGKFPAGGSASLPLRLPPLPGGLVPIISDAAFSFADFRTMRSVGLSEAYHAELDSWMKRIWLEFRELELRLLLETLRHSLVQ